jgi:hypothetical protein
MERLRRALERLGMHRALILVLVALAVLVGATVRWWLLRKQEGATFPPFPSGIRR